MDPQQAQELGKFMRAARSASGMSALKTAARAGMHEATVLRIENGQFEYPTMDKLVRLAEVLDLDHREVLRMADYPVPALPNLSNYLRERFAHLPEETMQAIERYAVKAARKSGLGLDPPPEEQRT